MFRLVATDLDGTLLRRDLGVSERNRRALARAREAGAVVVLVTARAPDTLRPIARAAGVSGLAIGCNGAILYDLDRDAVLRHTPLDAGTVRALVLALRAALPDVAFGFRLPDRFACDAAYRALGDVSDETLVGDALALCERTPAKLIVRHPSLAADELLALVGGLGLDGFHATHSGAPFVEIAADGVTKGSGLAGLCADLGIAAEEVVAFGDAPNDLPMLAWAGLGVAPANAHPAVLDAADLVAPHHEADGVAHVLEQIFGADA